MLDRKVSFRKVDKLLRAGKWQKALYELAKIGKALKIDDHALKYEVELRRADALSRSGKRFRSRLAAAKLLALGMEAENIATRAGWRLLRDRFYIVTAGILLGAFRYEHFRK